MPHNSLISCHVTTSRIIQDYRRITPEPLIVPVIQSYYPIMLIS